MRNLTEYQLLKLHRLSFHNRDLLEAAGAGVCFHCFHQFGIRVIEWTADDTAICPNCSVDAVVPNRELLQAWALRQMHERWFSILKTS
tara:strand:+ start:973 stop:1236 length:264 start_codon:yes stop_codon:yes gene_type:complete